MVNGVPECHQPPRVDRWSRKALDRESVLAEIQNMTDEQLADAMSALDGIADPYWHLFGWFYATAIDDEYYRREIARHE